MTEPSELFNVFELPILLKHSDYSDLIEELKAYINYPLLGCCTYHGYTGLIFQIKQEQSEASAKQYLKELCALLEKSRHSPPSRKPATPITIHWPDGAEIVTTFEGTALAPLTRVLVGNRHVAYLTEGATRISLASGYLFKKDGDSSLRVELLAPEFRTEGDRLIASYRKFAWDKSSAWDDLKKHYGLTRDHNPFRKSHTHSHWQYSAALEDFRDTAPNPEPAR